MLHNSILESLSLIYTTSTNASQLHNVTSLLDRRSRLMMYGEEDDDRDDAKWRGREIISGSPRVGEEAVGSVRVEPPRSADSVTLVPIGFAFVHRWFRKLSHDWSSFILEITSRMLLTRRAVRISFVRYACWKLDVTLLLLLTKTSGLTLSGRATVFIVIKLSAIFSSCACHIFATSFRFSCLSR